jgi:hypothetical protein
MFNTSNRRLPKRSWKRLARPGINVTKLFFFFVNAAAAR